MKAIAFSEMGDEENALTTLELVVLVHTVRSHIKSIYHKLNVHSRYQLIVKAKEMSLI